MTGVTFMKRCCEEVCRGLVPAGHISLVKTTTSLLPVSPLPALRLKPRQVFPRPAAPPRLVLPLGGSVSGFFYFLGKQQLENG